MASRTSVSIIIPAYNSGSFIPETISTLLPQLLEHDEIIIVDDGSQDNTKTAIQKLNDPRLKYLFQENSGGPAKPRNVGCRAAMGEYIFIFDSDDLASPQKLDTSVKALDENPSAGFLFSNFDMIDESGNVISKRYVDRYTSLNQLLTQPVSEHLYYIPRENLLVGLFKANFIGTSSVLFRRSAWQRTQGFDEQLLNLDDRDMWFQLCRNEDALFLDLSLHKYRNRAGSISKLRARNQVCERIVLGYKIKNWELNKNQKNGVKIFLAKNHLTLGYIDFHKRNDRGSALNAFSKSFLLHPSMQAFKGIVKSLLPEKLYILLR